MKKFVRAEFWRLLLLLDDGVPSNFPWPNSAKSGLGPLGSLSACNRQVFGTGNLTCCATTEHSRCTSAVHDPLELRGAGETEANGYLARLWLHVRK